MANIEIKGLKEILQTTTQLKSFLKNPKNAIIKSSVQMTKSIDRNFKEEGRPVKWKKISPITVMFRKTRTRGRIKNMRDAINIAENTPILKSTGRLRLSFSSVGKSKGDGFLEIKPNGFEMGTLVPYAVRMQNGLSMPFQITKEMKINFAKNVSAKIGKGKSKKSNPFFWKTIKGLQKKQGKSFQIPARPFLMIQREDEDIIERIFISEANQFING